MRLEIKDTNFTTKYDWLFKLCDENGNDYYIMNHSFYYENNMPSPVTKMELDSLDKGQWISASFKEINGERVVISL